ncbi:hsp90 co-chaperone Cdc37 [Coemansia sp. RSA 1813]|nr:hsp90 co-chaperone Cdc37 [Coemansia sp. RSA 1646]KAJ1773945.1 hsp90 co-chaperone Cdc37 [Coemansia sp. RSA 1843]KAJ2089335.1 hsp90 co-chaperone Cdc37 [Coemansia sp. RSA 986]KAJ2214438.1 hsp90 co-chaperone Cdc37 [Coemansia sp. RSA 487]KAJ2569341.1 hsp90 co-chaperone Cdc37 [Coemansia sp. RSA 1813]
MPIDYSKWDNLELSDDSDVEIHPNIERGTFLRLRQKKIREERENRRMRKEKGEILVSMNKDLIESVTSLRDRVASADEPTMAEIASQWEKDIQVAREYKEKRDAAAKDGKEELSQPSDEEMMAALKARISDDLLKDAAKLDSLEEKRSAYVVQLNTHIEKLNKNLREAEKDLEEVNHELAKHIDPEAITHEGFSHSIVSNASSSGSKKPEAKKETQAVTTDEILNPGSVGKFNTQAPASAAADTSDEIDENGDLKLDNDAKKFASISSMSDSMDFILKNLSIVNSVKSDQILGHAFTLELAGRKKLSKQYVRQSLILTYILQMGSSGVNVFFSRIGSKGKPQDMFEADVESRYKHIQQRCKVIQSESAQDEDNEPEVESIQLQCDDPNAPIRISVPDESSDGQEEKARIELFHQLPEDFRNALKEGTIDAINKVLAVTPGPEAERILAVCGEGGFLGIDGEVLVDPTEKQNESQQ